MRLIDADLFKKKFTGQYEFMQRIIDDEPTVDPIKHGRWVNVDGMRYVKCSVCGNNIFVLYAYCPHCGAKVDLK